MPLIKTEWCKNPEGNDWLFTFEFDGEQRVINLPYESYCKLFHVGIGRLSDTVAREIITNA